MKTYVKRTWTIEHDWFCGHCQHKNQGRADKCFLCGKPIDSKHTVQPPVDMSYENRVKNTERFKDSRPDWVCAYCDHRNSASRDDCKECGSNKGEKKKDMPSGADTTLGGKARSFIKEVAKASIIVPPTSYLPGESASPPALIKADPSDVPRKVTKIKPGAGYRDVIVEETIESGPSTWDKTVLWARTYRRELFAYSFIGSCLIGIIWLLVWLFTWHNATAVVNSTSWHYHVSLRQREIDHGHDWKDKEPAHSFNESCHTEIRSYYPCNPHDCNPHQVGYDCNCRSVESCTPRESCRTSCSDNGNRSSTCSETCTTSNDCTSRQECSTCYRTEYDTCWDSCPAYDQMCDFDYPAWPQKDYADTTGKDHTLVRPNLTSPGNIACPVDPEVLYSRDPNITQCHLDSVEFEAAFLMNDKVYLVKPRTLADYDRYHTGARWNVQYNHAGQFREVGPQ